MQQEIISKTVPNCYMISTSDVGMRYDIHPKEKKILGHRYFLQAMDKVYGCHCLADAPENVEVTVEENYIRILFANTGAGLQVEGERAALFVVVLNGTPVPIKNMNVLRNTIVLTCEDTLKGALRVSFAEDPYYEVNLYNSAGIPMKPFSVVLEVS